MRIITIILCISVSISAKSQLNSITNASFLIMRQISQKSNSTQVIDSALNLGKKLIGHRYKYGGSSLSGFDCSGFISYIFRKYGCTFPHSSRAYSQIGETICKDSIKTLRKGDILLFKGLNSKSTRIGHVSIVVEASESQILMLHSCCDKGVAIENYTTSEYYPKRLIAIRRITAL